MLLGPTYPRTVHASTIASRGIENFADGVPDREAYMNKSLHLFKGTLLVGYLAYMESNLPKNWIQTYGRNHKRDYYCLRFVRNAFVHTNSDLSKLKPKWLGKEIDESKGKPKDITFFVQEYANDLAAGKIKFDVNNNSFPNYLKVNGGISELLDESEDIIMTLCLKIFHRQNNANTVTSP